MIRIEKVKNGFGYKVIQDEEIIGYYGEYVDNGYSEGVIYKDYDAFETGQGVCYINEYGFENAEQNAGELFEFEMKEYATSKGVVDNPYFTTDGYTRDGILAIAGGNEKLAQTLFEEAEWQCIETILDEMERTDFY